MDDGSRYIHGKWISCIYRMSQCYLEKRLTPLGLNGGVYIFMLTLFREDGLRQKELRERIFCDKGTAARTLAKLEDRGLVHRTPDPVDGRTKRVHLTEKGRNIEKTLRAILKSWNGLQEEGIPDEDMRITLKTLEKLGRNTAALVERERQEDRT